MLPAWRPVPSFGSTMFIFGIFGLIFLAIGGTLYTMSESITSLSHEYDTHCDTKADSDCVIEIQVESDMYAPIYVYYAIDNFYQNHRRYVKSRSNEQMMGNNLGVNDLDDCDPIKTNRDLGDDIKSVSGKDLDPDAAAYPCGLVARSVFTDQFTSITDASGKNYIIDDSDIAWGSDVEYRYKNLGISDWKDIQWLNIEDCKLILMGIHAATDLFKKFIHHHHRRSSILIPANLDSDCDICLFVCIEHFMVWMRTAGLPNFKKLYGRIDQDMPEGTYKVSIKSSYDVSNFGGSKSFVLSTTNYFGGTNYFLAICYLVIGILCVLFGFIFLIAYVGRKASGSGSASS